MSLKSSNRGDEAIARGIRADFTKADEVRTGRLLDRMNADMARLEAENASLRAELERAKAAYHLRTAERNGAIEETREARREAESAHNMMMSMWATITEMRKALKKLSAIVRDNMTPEQYHEARARACETYPELFK